MTDIPLNFRLDPSGELLQGLSEDGPMLLMDVALEAAGQRWAAPIEGCAELLVPMQTNLEDEYRHQAFYTAGVLACYAFGQSDAPEGMIVSTFKQMTLCRMPVSVLAAPNPLTGLEEVALEGHREHPEFKDHTDFVMEYYCEITQQPNMAKIALCGAGVALYQLERAWNKARDMQIEAVATAAQDVNWDALPWNETGGA